MSPELVGRLVDGRGVEQVEPVCRERAARASGTERNGRLRCGDVSVGTDDSRAVGGEREGGRPPDPAAGSDDQGGLAVEAKQVRVVCRRGLGAHGRDCASSR